MRGEEYVAKMIEFCISFLNKKQKSQSLGFDYRYIRVRICCKMRGTILSLGVGWGGGGVMVSNAPKINVSFVASLEVPSETKA